MVQWVMHQQGISVLFDDYDTPPKREAEIISMCSPTPADLQTVSGYVYVVSRGSGILITAAMNTYHLPLAIVTEHELETGEYIVARADANVVREIDQIHGNKKPSEYKPTRPNRTLKIGKHEIKFGGRVIVTSPDKFDMIDYIADTCKTMHDVTKIALVLEENEDTIDHLTKNGVDEVYLTRVNYNTKKKVMYALSALFRAKEHAQSGKDVILFIDSWNKLFRIYNSSVYEGDVMDVKELNIGAYTDLKSYFMEAKQIANGGSVTIVTNITRGGADTEKFIYDDFATLCTHHITI